MQRETALNLIAATFNQPFDESRFVYFASNLLNDISTTRALPSRHGAYIPQPFQGHIRQYKRPFVYYDPSGDRLDVLIVRLSKAQSLERARTMQRNFAAWYLKQEHSEPVEAALIAFYHDDMPDWRFSFVRLEYNFGDEGLEEKLTPVRRYSFLVGPQEPTHTAEQQLLPFLQQDDRNPTIDQLAAAFQVQTVSKQFFEAYKELFLRLVEETAVIIAADPQLQADFQRAEIELPNFAKKLLGQIVFLYFVQKKGWLGVAPGAAWGSGPRDFLRRLFAKADGVTYDNFFNDVLEPLFYRALAIQRPDDLFTIGGSHSKIPFLNGGLFEPMGNYDWENTRLLLPNSLFSNRRDERDEMGSGILDIFDRYNFTVWEEEPLEKEVAVDPEMLGKVFENLLEVQDRKSKGAFYTPREIVHYMCQESLINYLDTSVNLVESDLGGAQPTQAALFSDPQPQQKRLKTLVRVENVPREEIAALVRQGALAVQQDAAKEAGLKSGDYVLPESVRTHARQLDEALARIRLCDPAIGSGAFPVGMLHEIVQARLALATYLGAADLTGLGKPVRSPYDLKRHAIQESIYGVDIDAGAVEIAKLRLWLSLVVDEENYEEIQPLPNLDYKIVQGNSLLGVEKNLLNYHLFVKLDELKRRYFAETHRLEKARLKAQIDLLIAQLTGDQAIFDFEIYFHEVFANNGGFDVVIGNPPYVQLQKDGGTLAKLYSNMSFKTFARTGDIYALFYEKGCQVLKPGGHLCFITSNKWMRAGYGKLLREYFLKHTFLKTLIDFGDAPLFANATTYTNVLLLCKETCASKIGDCAAFDLSHKNNLRQNLSSYLASLQGAFVPQFSSERYLIVNHAEDSLKQKIEQYGIPLKQWEIEIYRGILTGYNEAFIIDRTKRDELVAHDPNSAQIIKPILRGKDIKRYKIDFQESYLIATLPSLRLNIEKYPAVKDYLSGFGQRLEQSGQTYLDVSGKQLKSRKKTGNKWFETQDQIGYYNQFNVNKVVWAEIVFDSAFYYDPDGYYVEATGFMMTGENIKSLVALLNSRLLTYAFKNYYSGGDLRGNTFRYKKAFLEQLPVIKVDVDTQHRLEGLVDRIQQAKAADPTADVAPLERQIDQLVYQLYGLTPAEIALVEGSA